jgi:hypothetical protein
MTEAQRLIAAARLLRAMVMLGNPQAGDVTDLRQRMDTPQPGDLVWETSTAIRALTDPQHALVCLGWYLAPGFQPDTTREQWESTPDRHQYSGQPWADSPGQNVHVIRPWGDPRGEYVWRNAEVLALPLELAIPPGWRR